MKNRTWLRIRSWHAASGVVSRGGLLRTVCGRWAPMNAPMRDLLPSEKSCEVCLRIIARQDDV